MKPVKTIMLTIGISTAMVLAPTLNAAVDAFLVITTCTQGNSGKPCKNNNNNGTTTTTTSGPRGAIKNGKTPDSTVSSTICGPGQQQGLLKAGVQQASSSKGSDLTIDTSKS